MHLQMKREFMQTFHNQCKSFGIVKDTMINKNKRDMHLEVQIIKNLKNKKQLSKANIIDKIIMMILINKKIRNINMSLMMKIEMKGE